MATGPRRMRDHRPYRVTVPKGAHPFVKLLFSEMQNQKICILDVAERSGVSRNTITNWRYEKNPLLPNIEACLNVVGMTLTVVRRE